MVLPEDLEQNWAILRSGTIWFHFSAWSIQGSQHTQTQRVAVPILCYEQNKAFPQWLALVIKILPWPQNWPVENVLCRHLLELQLGVLVFEILVATIFLLFSFWRRLFNTVYIYVLLLSYPSPYWDGVHPVLFFVLYDHTSYRRPNCYICHQFLETFHKVHYKR